MTRIARIAGGFLLVVAGVFMLVLPGPGIITIVAGVAILARDMEWARRLFTWAKAKLDVGKTDVKNPNV
jgi:uncharacterized protein (TIGR02611 family)